MKRFLPHVTVACIIERDGKFLLVRELIDGQERLNQPAGHLEADESLQQAAVRETLEETGWDIELTGVVGVDVYKAPANNETYVRTTFIGKAIKHRPTFTLDDGIDVYKAPANNETYVRTTFIGKAIKHRPTFTLDDGIIGPQWLTRDQVAASLDTLRSPMVLGVIDDYLAGRRFALEVVATDG
jgi:8-oxo-dGTP pyrophosphatase MutT (NUDIX family)